MSTEAASLPTGGTGAIASLPFATVAASECLLGTHVRWDGDHNGDVWPRRIVARLFDLVGLCPEVGVGMGVPRPPIRLEGDAAKPRAVGPDGDYTTRLGDYARCASPVIAGVAGYIFADRSPSCGLRGVKVYAADGSFRRVGRGIYAAAVLAEHPTLPAVDAETLLDDAVLHRFVAAVAAYRGIDASEHDIARAIELAGAAAGA